MSERLKELCKLDSKAVDLGEDSSVVDILDDVCQAIMSKENASHFPEDYGKISLSDPEVVITHVWNAWGLALNGGATEAVSCSDVDELENALFKLGAPDIAKAVQELFPILAAFDEKAKNYSSDQKDVEFFELKDGELREVDGVFYKPWDRIPRLVLQYLQANADLIAIDDFED